MPAKTMKTGFSISHQVWISLAVASLAWTSTSCSGTAEGLSSVSGKVVCNGQPAAGAILYLHRQPGGDKPPVTVTDIIPSAMVQEDGSFTVESAPVGLGAAPGKYLILIQWPEDIDPAPALANLKKTNALVRGKKVTVAKRNSVDFVPTDRLKGRYMDKSKALLRQSRLKLVPMIWEQSSSSFNN
jgi:hypothetical protein